MKIDRVYTSYFYQIRNFTPDMVPLSTAVFDPKWYHLNKGQNHVYIDKNGVINGLRINQMHPDSSCDYQCTACQKTGNPDTCDFLRLYKVQLENIPFEQFMQNLENYLDIIQRDYLKTDKELHVIFMVHEALGNKCSERRVIQDWFNDHGIRCTEWMGEMFDA